MSTVDSHVITDALFTGLVVVQSLRMILGHSAVAKAVLRVLFSWLSFVFA
jgi:hypothetical protein